MTVPPAAQELADRGFGNTYAFTSPLSDVQEQVRVAGLKDRVHYLSHGETYEFGVSRGHESTE